MNEATYTPRVESDLFRACRRGENDLVDQLLASKMINPSAFGRSITGLDTTALHIAAQNGHLGIVQSLIAREANVNIALQDALNVTPLHLATIRGHQQVADFLLNNGANPDARLSTGATPLFLATQKNNLDMVNLLLRYSASPKYVAVQDERENIPAFRDTAALTAEQLARQKGYLEIASALKAAPSQKLEGQTGLSAVDDSQIEIDGSGDGGELTARWAKN